MEQRRKPKVEEVGSAQLLSFVHHCRLLRELDGRFLGPC